MTFIPSKRIQRMDASGIRKVFDLASRVKHPINMSIGQPDFDVFEAVKESAIDSIRAGFNAYTPTQGLPELISLLKSLLKESRGRAPEELFITSGVSGGLFLVLQALLDPEDEIIIPDPFFVSYKQMSILCDAHPVFLDTYPGFNYNTQKLKELITPKTKAIIINSPSNPTGKIIPAKEINEVINISRENDLYLISDEIYESFIYDLPSLPSPFGHYEKCILLSGFSKSFGITGWRIGYVAGPKKVLEEMKKIQQYTFVCAPSFAQKAMLTSLDKKNQDTLKKHISNYRHKRDLFYSLIKDYFDISPPSGAFYAFLKAPNGNGDILAEKAIKNNLFIIPGSIFSNRKTHVRVSFAASDDTIRQGCKILNRLVSSMTS